MNGQSGTAELCATQRQYNKNLRIYKCSRRNVKFLALNLLNKVSVVYWVFLCISGLVANLIFFLHYIIILQSNDLDRTLKMLPADDFKTIVNFNDFDYLITKPKCKFDYDNEYNTTLPFFITLVHSKPANVEIRNALRDTFAHYDRRTKTYFLLGAVRSPSEQELIEKENAEHGDIIQGNFIDSYRNLTYKHVMALKWFTYNCANAKYLVKVDDNVFINTPNVYKYLINNTETTEFLMGSYMLPYETPRTGLYAVTRKEYPPKYFPAYVEKFAIIYSNDVVYDLYRKSRTTKFFWIDDVYVTGIVRMQLNVRITDLRPYLISKSSIASLNETSEHMPHPPNFMFSSQHISLAEQQLLWERTEWSRLNLDLDFE